MSRISVIVCTCNRSAMLERCLRSVAGNTLPPVEIVVVDQSTNRDTADLVERLSPDLPIILRYVHLDTTGQTKARNMGIKVARGDVVAFTDDDCTVDEGWLLALDREFDDPQIRCACGQTIPENHTERDRQALLSTLQSERRRLIRGRRNPVVIGRGNNMAFRKIDILNLGSFIETIGVGTPVCAGDDTDVFYRILETGGAIAYTPHALVQHGQPDDWRSVFSKKRGYAISSAAIIAARARHGDPFAVLLLAGKTLYEFAYLLCGGLLRLNPPLAVIGWHSLMGSLSGLKYILNSDFCDEIREATLLARDSCSASGRRSGDTTL